VCGYVNARNAFGGYAGEAQFVYYHARSYPTPQPFIGGDILTARARHSTEAFCPPGPTTVMSDAAPQRPARRP
jgi:hypothetical protein